MIRRLIGWLDGLGRQEREEYEARLAALRADRDEIAAIRDTLQAALRNVTEEYRDAIVQRGNALDEIERLRDAIARDNHEIEQVLGKALGYPPLYPDASDADDGTVGVGDHVAASLAAEAAARIDCLTREMNEARSEARRLAEALVEVEQEIDDCICDDGDGCDEWWCDDCDEPLDDCTCCDDDDDGFDLDDEDDPEDEDD